MGPQLTAAPATAIEGDGIPTPALMAFLSPDPALTPRHRIFAADPHQVTHARRFVRSALADCAAADDAVLLTSELVTNSVQHSRSARGGPFTSSSGISAPRCSASPSSTPAPQPRRP